MKGEVGVDPRLHLRFSYSQRMVTKDKLLRDDLVSFLCPRLVVGERGGDGEAYIMTGWYLHLLCVQGYDKRPFLHHFSVVCQLIGERIIVQGYLTIERIGGNGIPFLMEMDGRIDLLHLVVLGR